jgi:hypothetical protein
MVTGVIKTSRYESWGNKKTDIWAKPIVAVAM